MPSSGNDLLNTMRTHEVSDVMDDDGDYFIQFGSEFMVVNFQEKFANSTDNINVRWSGRSTVSTVTSPVFLEIYNVNTGTSTATDSYSESNQSGTEFMYKGAGFKGVAQSFSPSSNSRLAKATFYLRRTGSPDGYITARLYSHSGTYGTSSVPGNLIASSVPVLATSVPTSLTLTDFIFPYPTRLDSGTNYVISVEYANGDSSNNIEVGEDTTSPTHGGNQSTLFNNLWTQSSTIDVCFYIYITSWETLDMENLKPADTDFTLSGSVTTNVSNYYDTRNQVTCRVWQQVI